MVTGVGPSAGSTAAGSSPRKRTQVCRRASSASVGVAIPLPSW